MLFYLQRRCLVGRSKTEGDVISNWIAYKKVKNVVGSCKTQNNYWIATAIKEKVNKI